MIVTLQSELTLVENTIIELQQEKGAIAEVDDGGDGDDSGGDGHVNITTLLQMEGWGLKSTSNMINNIMNITQPQQHQHVTFSRYVYIQCIHTHTYCVITTTFIIIITILSVVVVLLFCHSLLISLCIPTVGATTAHALLAQHTHNVHG